MYIPSYTFCLQTFYCVLTSIYVIKHLKRGWLSWFGHETLLLLRSVLIFYCSTYVFVHICIPSMYVCMYAYQ